ncbi:hypothetical protein [Nocardia sp. NPDC050435]|uniref:hypothetical protein n=1 Tax=Nocardia sp. NPDC050435 TaxID=3155040 RepID=UPI0033DE2B37
MIREQRRVLRRIGHASRQMPALWTLLAVGAVLALFGLVVVLTAGRHDDSGRREIPPPPPRGTCTMFCPGGPS